MKNSKDIHLFEQESIQLIIDYKWKTYTVDFFKMKFMLYMIYIATFSIGCQLMLEDEASAAEETPASSASTIDDSSPGSIRLAKDGAFWLT